MEVAGKSEEFQATVDTESTRSCIAKRVIDSWGNPARIEHSETKLIIANGEENDAVVGEIIASTYFNNGTEVINHKFIVIQKLPVDILIGLDLIAEIGTLQIDAIERVAMDDREMILLNNEIEEFKNENTGTRREIPDSIFEGSILTDKEKDVLRELLIEYADIMASSKKEAVCSKYEATIPMMEGSKPFVRIKPYPIPIHYKETA